MNQRVTLEQAKRARPYKPTCTSEDFADDTVRTNELLEQAGAAGMTVPELRARGCGERPPNRICDLRKKHGMLIVTRRDPNGVTRYIKAKFLPEQKARTDSWEMLSRNPVKTDKYGRPLPPESSLGPLFDRPANLVVT